jgi:rare lipoprotein A
MRRFRRRRRRLAALALLPVTASASMIGLAAPTGWAQDVAPGEAPPEAEEGRLPTKTQVHAKRHVMAGEAVPIRGTVKPAADGLHVVVHVPGRDQETQTGPGGGFGVKWSPGGPGNYRVQASVRGDATTAGSESRAVKVTAYRKAAASWYGPGFYGNTTACGKTLTGSTLGVAHKSLPCGTKLTLRYGGRSVDVRVVDRGPYAGDREFDLTGATKQRLGFPSTGTVLSSK